MKDKSPEASSVEESACALELFSVQSAESVGHPLDLAARNMGRNLLFWATLGLVPLLAACAGAAVLSLLGHAFDQGSIRSIDTVVLYAVAFSSVLAMGAARDHVVEGGNPTLLGTLGRWSWKALQGMAILWIHMVVYNDVIDLSRIPAGLLRPSFVFWFVWSGAHILGELVVEDRGLVGAILHGYRQSLGRLLPHRLLRLARTLTRAFLSSTLFLAIVGLLVIAHGSILGAINLLPLGEFASLLVAAGILSSAYAFCGSGLLASWTYIYLSQSLEERPLIEEDAD